MPQPPIQPLDYESPSRNDARRAEDDVYGRVAFGGAIAFAAATVLELLAMVTDVTHAGFHSIAWALLVAGMLTVGVSLVVFGIRRWLRDS